MDTAHGAMRDHNLFNLGQFGSINRVSLGGLAQPKNRRRWCDNRIILIELKQPHAKIILGFVKVLLCCFKAPRNRRITGLISLAQCMTGPRLASRRVDFDSFKVLFVVRRKGSSTQWTPVDSSRRSSTSYTFPQHPKNVLFEKLKTTTSETNGSKQIGHNSSSSFRSAVGSLASSSSPAPTSSRLASFTASVFTPSKSSFTLSRSP